MPSSLAVSLSSALVYSTRPPVSVYGTGRRKVMFSGFSWKHASSRSPSPGGSGLLFSPQLNLRICLEVSSPNRFCALFRLRAEIPLLRHHITLEAGCGLFTACPSKLSLRMSLRPRLTLNRLALFRNPWSYGGRVSRPPYRYLFPHLLLKALHRPSRNGFFALSMLPYRPWLYATDPRLRRRSYARVLSTQGRSTSELLRTL